MDAPRPDPPGDRRLDSWKEIAAYLKRDVRTVQRWEKHEGLAVHRLHHRRRGAVYAYASELDAWWRSRATPDGAAADLSGPDAPPIPLWRGPWMRVGIAAGALAAVAAVVLAWRSFEAGRVEVASVEIADGRLIARSADGRELWSALPEAERGARIVSELRPMSDAAIGDADGDDRRDVIVSIGSRQGTDPTSVSLQRFDARGRARWKARIDDRLSFRSGEYGPPWQTADVAIFRAASGPKIAWTVHQHVWWPSMLVTLDGNGRIEQRFVHAGWLGAIEASRDGRHLLVTGVSNDHDDSVLVALPVDRTGGHAPVTPGSRYECLDCSGEAPARYLRLPRVEGALDVPLHLLVPSVQVTHDGEIIVRIDHDSSEGGSESIYEFSERLELLRASFSNAYWERHRKLEAAGAIRHAARVCPEAEGPPALAYEHGAWTRLRPLAQAATEAANATPAVPHRAP